MCQFSCASALIVHFFGGFLITNVMKLHVAIELSPSPSSHCQSLALPCSASRRSLSASTRVPIAQLSFVPIRAIHASGIKQVGDFVNEDELVAEIETDKTSVEVPAPQSGTIVELLVEDGAKVTAKQQIYKLQPGSAGAAPASAPPKEAPKPEPPKAAPKPEPPKEAPKPDKSHELLLPSHGHHLLPCPLYLWSISQFNVLLYLQVRVKMNRMRLRIASRLKDAQNTFAMLTTFNEIDMSNVIEMRSKYQKDFMKKHGIKLGLMSPFVRAAAYALQENPVVNAVIDENEIIYRHFVDMSIAVATPKGLVVPVLRNVESMNYAQIEMELAALGEKARDNKLAVEDMEGGTFTISNGGVFGSVFGTPIINPPQSAILGMHGIFDRPVEIRPIMQVALTYDHRLIDGREAVTFLRKIKSAVEDPRTILMNI
ncbi:dihydrolipoyllysine-residue succinyltransferase [Ancylostoma ceylanicum]|uniref:Dihydrolipoyllysine-residue succinyltransferase component of 2-oxoglutarate dehydrogenase complex, mitochondrial n=1 Tax=Ancylostoma ceylanicum TaxID=53326 RepID=A0A0D6M3E8_9BILA|nr:dihydrolipoyllysine-residue succinyltransferase [Ancylostoma ceylanicum]